MILYFILLFLLKHLGIQIQGGEGPTGAPLASPHPHSPRLDDLFCNFSINQRISNLQYNTKSQLLATKFNLQQVGSQCNYLNTRMDFGLPFSLSSKIAEIIQILLYQIYCHPIHSAGECIILRSPSTLQQHPQKKPLTTTTQ